ncbi:MAG: AAA family ATPase, partial [Elusimicrobia bacterium]|nr:AAA family ATPase [Elusimicrobiota bacterium]
MLIEFEVGNYLSFKAPVRLSMLAANPIKEFMEENTFQTGRYRLLKCAVVYGANASGKSNLLSAMAFMRFFVLNSSKEMQAEEKIQVMPFKFDTTTENAPSHFEICFLQNERRYRYGFEADRKAVRKEW